MRTKHYAAILPILMALGLTATPALSQQKTVKACQQEWRANKAANQAAKITEKAYVEKCRAEANTGGKTNAATTAPKSAPSASTSPAARPSRTTGVRSNANAMEYSSEAQAKASCGGDTVVWVNLQSKIYHFAGHRDYGHTKSGAYMCERNTAAAGFRAAKNEKHP